MPTLTVKNQAMTRWFFPTVVAAVRQIVRIPLLGWSWHRGR